MTYDYAGNSSLTHTVSYTHLDVYKRQMEEIGRVPDVGDRFQADGLDVCVTRVEHRLSLIHI